MPKIRIYEPYRKTALSLSAMSDIIPPEDRKFVDSAVEKLLEHFDSVRTFVTRHRGDEDSTGSYSTGGGNYYASKGQVFEWVEAQGEYTRMKAREKEDSND